MIRKFFIQNFRCLESFTLDLADAASALPSALIIGRNGSGKSTILQALAVVRGIGCELRQVEELISRRDFSFHQTTEPMRFELEVVLEGQTILYGVSLECSSASSAPRITEEKLSVDGARVFSRQCGQLKTPEGAVAFKGAGSALRIADAALPASAASKLIEFLRSLYLLAPLPGRMSGFSDRASSELAVDASNFAACLRGLLEREPAAYEALVKFLRYVIPDLGGIEAVDRGDGGQQWMVNFPRPEPGETAQIEFDALSEGEKCFFLGGYLIASTAAGVPVTCVWDEPDNHLAISEVGQFVIALRKMANSSGQFIAISHHPETIRMFSDDNTFVLTRASQLESPVPRLLRSIDYYGDVVDALIRNEVYE